MTKEDKERALNYAHKQLRLISTRGTEASMSYRLLDIKLLCDLIVEHVKLKPDKKLPRKPPKTPAQTTGPFPGQAA